MRNNLEGSRQLFRLVAENGARVIFISSLGAFQEAKSNYGQTKFALERDVAAQGGISIRPGLVYGGGNGGIVQSLDDLVKKVLELPLIDGSNQTLYPCHIDELVHFTQWMNMPPPGRRGAIIPGRHTANSCACWNISSNYNSAPDGPTPPASQKEKHPIGE